MTVDITFITLTWNSQAYVRRCLDSIMQRCATDGLNVEVIVVDNGSRDESVRILEEFREDHPDSVTLIALDRNRGTTWTRNLAMKRARGRFLCVLDSDTEFLSGSLRPVLSLLSEDRQLAIVAPRLILPDGSVQHSAKRFPSFLDKLRKVPRILFRREVPTTDFYASFPFRRRTCVDTAISACWVFRADLLDSVGLLDEQIFYAPEDLDYSARIREAGLYIAYEPGLTLLHHTQQVSHRRPLSSLSLSHLKGLVRYHRKHGGWFTRPDALATPWPSRAGATERWAVGLSREATWS
ncbi:MAG: glycosyltransferase [Acidobacteriota bacterium]